MRRKSIVFCLITVFLFPLLAFSLPQQTDPEQKAAVLLQKMTLAEKIGQLFLVSFKGKDLSDASDIYKLINQYHIGGVVLKRENGNWKSGTGEAAAVLTLTNNLQAVEGAFGSENGQFIPLFIAISQEGDGYPGDQLATDMTELPTEMAMGAGWQPDLATQAGRILGRELSILGVNMLLGPSLDVLERPNPGTTGDLGVRTFGGDPFWVGQFGRAYIIGVKAGSNSQIAIIATHFPGIGASDRSPYDEVATIRKSLDDLQQVDLVPFAIVADGVPGQPGVTDGLLVSHIRYQGLQGNIRASTRPVSLDPQALGTLMGLPSFSTWRSGGGITVSDSLGTNSVRKFDDPSGTTFHTRTIALNAFQANNDILQLTNFSSPDFSSEYDTITDTIRYFQQKYLNDKTFAAQVDQAVTRILTLKYRLNPLFTLDSSTHSDNLLSQLGQGEDVSQEVCRDGATLLSPLPGQTGGTAIEPPSANDRILILSDSRSVLPCPACGVEQDIAPNAFADTILNLYGPAASGFVHASRISSFTLKDLYGYFQGGSAPELEKALSSSTIIIALIQNSIAAAPETHAFQDLLSQRGDIIRNKKIIVFALGAPYYLDSTEISKLDAYYALYSKSNACLVQAARLLYGDASAIGASPVSVEGIGYDLLTALSPDPSQIIPVTVTPSTSVVVTPTAMADETQTTTPEPQGFLQGDTINIQAGPVYDHNRHTVPDGTIIQFTFVYSSEDMPPQYLSAPTLDGYAVVSYALNRQGELQVSASSEPAVDSILLRLKIGEQPAFVTAISPAVETVTETFLSPSVTQNPSAGGTGSGWFSGIGLGPLFASIILIGTCAFFGTEWLARGLNSFRRWQSFVIIAIGGLAGYDLVMTGILGTAVLRALGGGWLALGTSLLGSFTGMGMGWFFLRGAGSRIWTGKSAEDTKENRRRKQHKGDSR